MDQEYEILKQQLTERNHAGSTLLENAVLYWWKEFRPEGWTEQDHIQNPHRGTNVGGERLLALAAAKIAADRAARRCLR